MQWAIRNTKGQWWSEYGWLNRFSPAVEMFSESDKEGFPLPFDGQWVFALPSN